MVIYISQTLERLKTPLTVVDPLLLVTMICQGPEDNNCITSQELSAQFEVHRRTLFEALKLINGTYKVQSVGSS